MGISKENNSNNCSKYVLAIREHIANIERKNNINTLAFVQNLSKEFEDSGKIGNITKDKLFQTNIEFLEEYEKISEEKTKQMIELAEKIYFKNNK